MQPDRDRNRELGRAIVRLARGTVARSFMGLPQPGGEVIDQVAAEFALDPDEIATMVGTCTRFLASEARRRARRALPANVLPMRPQARRPMARGAA